jgi:hypothetical protein
MIIMVISSHLGSEEMILPASRCTLRSSVAGPAHRQRRKSGAEHHQQRRQLGEVRLATWNVNSIKQRSRGSSHGWDHVASGVAPPPEQAVLIMPLSS